MLLKTQRNQLFQELIKIGFQPADFTETIADLCYRIEFENLWFEVKKSVQGRTYRISHLPGWNSPDVPYSEGESDWINDKGYGVLPSFRSWANAVKREIDAPDLGVHRSHPAF